MTKKTISNYDFYHLDAIEVHADEWHPLRRYPAEGAVLIEFSDDDLQLGDSLGHDFLNEEGSLYLKASCGKLCYKEKDFIISR